MSAATGVVTALAWAAAVASAPATGMQEQPERTYRAVRAVDPMVIDGRVTETTWELAPRDDRFGERQPDLGAKPPVRTTMRVAYDDLALYVLLECESKPGDVIVRTLRRDNPGIFSDDAVYVKLDPTH